MNFSDIKHNRVLQSVLAIGVIMLLLAAVLLNSVMAVFENRTTRALEEEMLATEQQHIERLLELKAKETENRDLVASYEQQMPKSPEQDAILSTLASLSERYGVTVNTVEFAQVVELENFHALPLTISVDGSYAKVLSFLEEMTYAQRIVQMDQLTIGTKDVKQATVAANAQFTAYYQ